MGLIHAHFFQQQPQFVTSGVSIFLFSKNFGIFERFEVFLANLITFIEADHLELISKANFVSGNLNACLVGILSNDLLLKKNFKIRFENTKVYIEIIVSYLKIFQNQISYNDVKI